MRYFLIWLLLLPLMAEAQIAAPVVQANEIINLAPNAQYVEDRNGQVSIEDVLHARIPASFQPVGDVPSFGVTSSYFWLRASVRNETGEKLILQIGTTAITDVWIYEVAGNQIVNSYHSGNWQPYAQRPVDNAQYIFPLLVQKGATATVYVKIMHLRGTQFPLLIGAQSAIDARSEKRSIMEGIYYGFMLLMILYNLFIYFTLRDTSYLYYVGYTFLMGFFNAALNGYLFRFLYPSVPALNQYEDAVACLMGISGILFADNFLNTKHNAPLFHKLFRAIIFSYAIVIGIVLSGRFMLGTITVEIISLLLVVVFFAAAYTVLRKGFKPARFFLIGWTLLLLSVVVFILKDFKILPFNQLTVSSLQIGSAAEALLLSLALADRINVYKKETMLAQQEALRSLEEKRKLITGQKDVLEKTVEERTKELKRANRELITALRNLKETQAQLVQKEKMASLGELTAGIAHEIQNPLNFVNNFSEVSKELAEELKSEIGKDGTGKASELVGDLKINLDKIISHSQRADSIVKGMLQHSRISTGSREEAAINDLVEEYLHLSYHGLRAKDKTFTCIIETHFDEAIGKIEIVPQDIGRVLLNLFNNAFYSVREKKKRLGGDYHPMISVYTKKVAASVTVSIRDNGAGIPEKIKEKIFQPFFTTKPTGEGTGLGLSLSYDIVKAHGGDLQVETKEGEFAEFMITLPA